MSTRKNIALSGKPGAGKDTVAAYLVSHGYKLVRIAAPLYRVCEQLQELLGWPKVKNRALLQNVGEIIKAARGDDVWINIALLEIKAVGNTPIVIPDCRFMNEYDKLHEAGFEVWRINRPGVEDNHRCESQLDNCKFDRIIDNNGSIEDLNLIINEYLSL